MKKQNSNSTYSSAYQKERNRILNQIKRMEKRGYIFDDFTLPKTPKKKTKASVNKLKNITTETLYSKSTYVDVETGEYTTGLEGRKLERTTKSLKSSETRKAHKKAEQEFWEQSTPINTEELPNGGEIILDNAIDTFISKLSTPTPQLTYYGSKRLVENYDASERERVTLYSLLLSVIQRDGKAKVGWRLQESGDRVWDLIQYVLYGSDAATISSTSRELAEIINGSQLTLSQIADLAYEQDQNEWHELPQ